MKTLWNPDQQQDLRRRVARLTADTPARWGRMSCAQMVVHVTDALALYAGELTAAAKRTPLQYAPLKHAVVYLMPMPKNVATAPELTTRVPAGWNDEIARLDAAIRSFAGQHTRRDWPRHPIFGRLSARAYGVLAYKHTDHHLRQFGA